MKTRASLTAEYMALFRGLESSRPANSRLFNDSFAAGFLGGRRKWLYRVARLGYRRFVERVLDSAAPGARAAGIARTKWIDDEVTAALAEAKQLVLLGAGFDTRAFRLPAAARAINLSWIIPRLTCVKQAALKKNGSLPDRVRFITLDFIRQSVRTVLDQAGFDKTQTACFVWEGVTNYLTAEAVDAVLRQVRTRRSRKPSVLHLCRSRSARVSGAFLRRRKVDGPARVVRRTLDVWLLSRCPLRISCGARISTAGQPERC